MPQLARLHDVCKEEPEVMESLVSYLTKPEAHFITGTPISSLCVPASNFFEGMLIMRQYLLRRPDDKLATGWQGGVRPELPYAIRHFLRCMHSHSILAYSTKINVCFLRRKF